MGQRTARCCEANRRCPDVLSPVVQRGVQGRYCDNQAPLLDPSAASRKRFRGAGRTEGTMGDKSPKAKQRDQKQKDAARTEGAAQAKSKQDSYRQTPSIPGKGKK